MPAPKRQIGTEFLGAPAAHLPVRTIFIPNDLSNGTSLADTRESHWHQRVFAQSSVTLRNGPRT